MNKIIFLTFLFFIAFSAFTFGQNQQQSERIRRDLQEYRRTERAFKNLRGIEIDNFNIFSLKLSDEDKRLIAPSDADKTKNADLLRLPNAEIVKLLNISCFKIGEPKLDAVCGNNNIPGFGGYYSFRHGRHLFAPLSDIQLFNGWIVSAGFLTQGIIVSLGEVNFEKVSLESTGANFLSEFTPADTADGADEQSKQIEKGFTKDGFKYNRAIQVRENDVYVMRSIAYRSKVKTLDKREDIIVAFKVISQDAHGNVTLIWRKLKSETAPRIKTDK